ncbi:MAG: ABC transporter permease subunit, partial [Armatimonadota bacterium]|nr:ABC transporter permease subunit [Armatimonadota bacterium]
MIRVAWAVLRKELLETARDRRTLLLAVLLPVVVMPAVALGLPALAVREETRLRHTPSRVAVVGGESLRAWLETAAARGWIEVVAVPAAEAALRRGAVHAVLEATPGPPGEPVRLRVLYDEGSVASLLARQKIDRALAEFSLAYVEAELVRRAVRPEQLLPLQVEYASVTPPGRAGGRQLALVLPFFMTVWMLLGGQYAALDLGAGERERGTLPALLLAPPDRLALVLGKFGAVFVLATASVVLVVATVLLSLRLTSAASAALPASAAGALLGAGLAFAAFLSALQLLLSLAARSVREAQQLFTPVYLLAVGSVLLAQILPEWGQRTWVYALPGLNGAFLLRALLLDGAGLPELVLGVLV